MTQILNMRLVQLFMLLMAGVGAFILAADRARAGDPVLPTSAIVDGVGSVPHIECKWELPDMDSSTLGIQYTSPIHQHDDDMGIQPGPPIPCDLTRDATGAATGSPTMADNVHKMIQVKANTEDKPEERRIQLWMAVDHPNGISNISDVFWQVYHPDGTEKIQVHGTKVPVAECAAYGNGTVDGTMFEAAVHTGQLSAGAVNDPNLGIVAKCAEQVKALYYAEFNLSKHQACGEYRIKATAVGASGANVSLTNYIDIICQFYLDKDFTAVDWGTISPGLTKVVSGDLLMTTPNNPTVINRQNDGMGLRVVFSTMVGKNFGKVIDQFDACFGRSALTLLCIDPIFAPPGSADFGVAPAQVLCANEVGKLDLSIHPPSTLPSDIYAGTVTLIGYHVAGECKGKDHIVH